jgi:class 3 adenylate cyclase
MIEFKAFVLRFRDGLVWMVPLALVSAVLALLFSIGPVSEVLQGNFTTPRQFRYPVAVDFDTQNNLYVIDTNSRRILSFSPGGKQRWTLEGGKRTGGFYESYRLAAKPGGGALVYNAILDPEDGSLEAEEILSFSGDGTLEGTLVRSFYPKEQRGVDNEHIGAFQVHGSSLWYLFKDRGKLTLHERALAVGGSTDPEVHPAVFSAALPAALDYVTAVPHLPEGLVLTERSGGVFVLDEQGQVSVPAFASPNPMLKPWDVKAAPDGSLYFLDLVGRSVWKADSLAAPTLTKVFSQDDVLKTGRNKPSFESIAVGPTGVVGIVDKFNHSVFMKLADGATLTVEGGPKTLNEQVFDSLWVAIAVLALVSSLWSVVGLLRRFLATRTSIIIKQVALLLPLVVASAYIGSVSIYQLLDDRYQKELRTKLTFIATIGAQSVDGSLVGQITKASDFQQTAHLKLQQQVNALLNGRADPWNEAIHSVVYKYENDEFYLVKTSSPYYGVMYPYGGASREHYAAARGGKVQFTRYSDEYGTYLSALAPLVGADGVTTGVLEIYHNDNTAQEMVNSYNDNLFRGIVFSVLMVLLLLIVTDVLIFLALGYLQKASEKVTQGELGITVRVRHHDEIGDLALDFNTMSTRLMEHFGRLKEVRDANARFVPHEFIDFLGKESLAEIESGDQIRRKVTLFFADIRSFTSLSEGMTPKENFDFINSYLGVMGPVIRRNGGFIEHYLGDAIMAIFPDKPEDAVKAGLEMREILVDFNRQREEDGQVPIAFGVGLHTEDIILGVVGERSRLAATVVSDAVDLVNRLEAATKTHHVGLVMTEAVWKGLPKELQDKCPVLGDIDYNEDMVVVHGI